MNHADNQLEPSKRFAFDTLRWREGKLEMIDQRVLPHQVRFIAFHSAQDVASGIRDMVVRGAPAIGCAAAYGMALEAKRLESEQVDRFTVALQSADHLLRRSRPTAINLAYALDLMAPLWRDVLESPQQTAASMLRKAQEISENDVAVNLRLGEHGAALLADGARVLTHCNAGALATAGHGTALGVVRSAIAQGKRISVIADETRPFLQGARLTAWELQQDDIPVTLITDGMAGYLMRLGDIDAVVVGCDRVAANGDVANKIGTYMVAVLAKRHRIPFYVACPLSTIDLSAADGDAIPIEERPAKEVLGHGSEQWSPHGVATRNPSFDITPAELVTGLVTERGVILAPDREKIAALFR
jgi:methylthioribose-1-phosphate isomerase